MAISTTLALMYATSGAVLTPEFVHTERAPDTRGGTTLVGELSEFSPVWDRRKDDGAVASDDCNALALDSFNDGVPYQLFILETTTPDDALEVTVRSLEAAPIDFDPFVCVYCDPFEPTSPETGLIAVDDDDAGYPDARIAASEGLLIQPGQRYYVVVTSYATYEGSGHGMFEVEVGGDATLTAPCDADVSGPFGELDIDDVLEYLELFEAMNPAADLAEPLGVFDFSDVFAFITSFGAGCP